MAELSQKDKLNEAWFKLTGLAYSLYDVIEGTVTEEEKKKLARHIYWHVKNGIIRTSNSFKILFKDFYDNLGDFQTVFNENADYNNDGIPYNEADEIIKNSIITIDSGSEE